MANPARSQGIHVLDDFVCEAIHEPSVSPADSSKQGRNEGMSVIREVAWDAREEPISKLPEVVKSEVHQLASFISNSSDPANAKSLVQKLLLEELASIQKSGHNGGSTES